MDWLYRNATQVTVLSAFLLWMAVLAYRQLTSAEVREPAPKMPGWMVGISFYATFLSTNTFIGQAGYGYAVGISWLLGAAVFFGRRS